MSAPFDRKTATGWSRAAYRARRLLARGDLLVGRLPTPRPWMVLAALTVVSWGIAAEVGRIAQHDGWYYYNGGDSSWYYTTAWVLAHGHLPPAEISYGYPLLIAPFAGIAGPNILDGLPSIVIFNELVLAPIALLCVYGITRTFASRFYAYLVTLIWVVFPVAVIHYFTASYHSRYVDVTLPSALGLTPLGDYPSMVALLVSAYFVLRFIATRADLDAVAAGLAAGLAVVIKPANLLFLPAPVVALMIARRPRGLGVFAAALVPGLIGLTVWKYRGLGYLPALPSAAGAGAIQLAVVAPLAFAGLNLHRYLPLDWHQLRHNFDSLGEYTWSAFLIYVTAIAGLVGLARRSFVAASLAGVWIASYLVIKGSSGAADVPSGDFFTHMIAAFPGFFLLVVSVPFLVPINWGRRPLSPLGSVTSRSLARVTCATLGAVTLVGIVLVAALPRLSTPAAAVFVTADLYLPLDTFPLKASTTGTAVTLAWALRPPAGTRATFAIFRNPTDEAFCTPQGHGAILCVYDPVQHASVGGDASSYTDHPPPGTWTYRVALSETPDGPQAPSDYLMLSRPIRVRTHP